MTLTITQPIGSQLAHPVKSIAKQTKPVPPLGRWYTDANGKLVCGWMESV
ncbi:hypothetical protein [Chamaesiphon polymorphus]|nr:hypothetical protein [Chamaesiphon polymorphus]